MNEKLIIKEVSSYVENKLAGEATGHDWWHAFRVWKMALKIAKQEKIAKKEKGVDLFVMQSAALLHDIADWKFQKKKDDSIASKTAIKLLKKFNIRHDKIRHIAEIIEELSFKGAGVKTKIQTMEGMIVQDADRLDTLGAIGISRTFATGSKLNRQIYDPSIKPRLHKTFADYKNAKSTSINHFHEKLFLLKDLMNTKTAKKIAIERELFLKLFLKQFLAEWNGEM